MKNKKTIGIRISGETYKDLIELGKLSGENVSQLVRRIVIQYVKQVNGMIPKDKLEEK